MLVLVPAVASRAGAQRLDYGATLAATRGAFVFAEPTMSWVLTQSVVFDAERWRLGADLPLVMQNSSAITWIGGAPVPTGGPDAGALRNRQSDSTVPMGGRHGTGGGGMGPALHDATPVASALADSGYVTAPGDYAVHLGDPVLHAATELFLGAEGRTRLGASVLAKLPVADVSSGVGTGQFDYGAGLSFSTVAARTFVFADLSHWVIGDLPDLPLRDLTAGALGLGATFGEMGRLSLMGTVSGATAVVSTVDPPLTAGMSLGLAVRERRFLTLGATVGLSESVPDWGVTVGWRASRPYR